MMANRESASVVCEPLRSPAQAEQDRREAQSLATSLEFRQKVLRALNQLGGDGELGEIALWAQATDVSCDLFQRAIAALEKEDFLAREGTLYRMQFP